MSQESTVKKAFPIQNPIPPSPPLNKLRSLLWLPPFEGGREGDLRGESQIPNYLLIGLGIVLAMIVWLIPVHRAWYLSNEGFRYLSQNQVGEFREKLTVAQQLVPWEPYYPYQLGWNLGNLSLETADAKQQQELRQAAISEFERGIAISPDQEFGHSNLGWLLLTDNPAAAQKSFVRASQLVPAKRGVNYGLGLSLLAQGKTNLAIKAFVREGLRDPLYITSPFWRSPQLRPLWDQITDSMAGQYTQWLQQYSQPGELNTYLHRCRGGLYWWRGNFSAARQDLEVYGTPLSKLMLDLAEGKPVEPKLSQLPESAAKFALMMWLKPQERLENLPKAWLMATKEPLNPGLKQNLLASMGNSASFHQWLTQKSPSWQYRRQRLGFGIVSRHLDGPPPTDFFPVVENIAMVNWFSELLPSPVYFPELDLLNYEL